MPLALHQSDGRWQLVAVCGLTSNHNLFVKNGQWLGHYQPIWLQTYPFALMPVGDKAYPVIDSSTGHLLPDASGEAFFDAADQLTPATSTRIALLQANFGRQQRTEQAIQLLVQHQLLTTWPQTLTDKLGQHIKGLHMVNEQALQQLSDNAFLTLRQGQALGLAYALNLSIAQHHLLNRLQKINPPAPAATDINLDAMFQPHDDTLRFNF